jgi:malonyl-CoA/methylmalonyl-CoA synthetase
MTGAGADPTDGNVNEATLHAWRLHLGSELEPAALRRQLTAGTLPEAFHATAERRPERVALVVDEESITHGELDTRAARVGGWLKERGLGPSQTVLLSGTNSLQFVVAYLGVLRAGCTVLPASPDLTEHELRYLLGDSGAEAALVQGDTLEKLSPHSGTGSLSVVVSLDKGAASESTVLDQVISEGLALEPQEYSGDVPAMLAYTSGTTGQPKGVPLSHANLLSSIRGALWAWRWDEEDVLVHALPFSHQHGLSGVHAALLTGSRTVVHGKFDPERFSTTVASERASVVFAVPAIYERLVRWDGIEETDYSSVRLAVCGSSALSPALADKASETLNQEVLERYGSTETGLNVSNPYEGPRRFGSVGLPLPGTEVAIVNQDGERIPDGGDGEIVLRGPQVFSGYWRRPEATRESFLTVGWFRTGDVGRIDPSEGYLYVTGRTKEMIISGGLNIYPREIELVLEEHPEVEQSAVVGVPSERWGEEVVAFVVLAGHGSTSASELAEHVRGKLSAHKVPKRFFEGERLPRNEMGKLMRDELVSMVEQHAYKAEL